MREQDLFGEISRDEIVKIAREAAKNSGYVVFAAYNEYMKRLICQGPLEPIYAGRYLQHIRKTLLADGWTSSPGHPMTRFYPPRTESPSIRRDDILKTEDVVASDMTAGT